MKSLRHFMEELLMAGRLGYSHCYLYSEDFINLEDIKESYSAGNSQILSVKLFDYLKNTTLKLEPSTTIRNIIGSGLNTILIKTSVTYSMILMLQCMTLHSITIVPLMS